MVRWETPNYNPPKDRKGLRNTVIAIAILFIAIMAVIGAYPYLNPQTTVTPPPQNSKICDSSQNICYTSQINSTQFGVVGLKWANNAIYRNYNNTVYPFQVFFNSTRDTIGIQF